MTERSNEIGRCRCPVCGSPKASVRVSAKQLAYIVCDACNVQAFARSDRSDELIRSRLEVAATAAAAPAAAPTPAPAPAAGLGWGVFR